MNQSSSKDRVSKKSSGKIAGLITVIAAIVTIVAFFYPKSDKNIEKIRGLLEDQKEMTLFSQRTVLPDSILNAEPQLKEASELQSEIEQYFRVCDRLNFPPEKDLTDETKEIVCIQNLKILIELEVFTQNIDQHIRELILLDPSIVNYLDMTGLEKVNDTNNKLNASLCEINEKISGLSNGEKKIKAIWKFFNSKDLYPALESKKDAYASLFKTCEVVINKQR